MQISTSTLSYPAKATDAGQSNFLSMDERHPGEYTSTSLADEFEGCWEPVEYQLIEYPGYLGLVVRNSTSGV